MHVKYNKNNTHSSTCLNISKCLHVFVDLYIRVWSECIE